MTKQRQENEEPNKKKSGTTKKQQTNDQTNTKKTMKTLPKNEKTWWENAQPHLEWPKRDQNMTT